MPPKRQPPRKPTEDPSEQTSEATVKPDPDAAQPAQASAGAEQGASSGEAIPISSKSATPASSHAGTPTPTPSTSTQRPGSLSRPHVGRPPSTRGKPAVATPKFTGRRSATARAEAEKAEAERKRVEAEAKAREDAANARREGNARQRERGRGGGGQMHKGRGRGGYMGEGDRQQLASGPFSAGQVNQGLTGQGKRRASAVSSRDGRGGSGGGGGGGGSSGHGIGGGGGSSVGAARSAIVASTSSSVSSVVKQEPGTVRTVDGDGDVSMIPRMAIRTEDGGYISSDEEEEVNKGLGRMNVDDLGVIDLTPDDDALSDPTRAFQPVRLKREAHKDRTLGLNADGATTKEGAPLTEASDPAAKVSDKKKGKQRAKDIEITGASETFQATYSSSDEHSPAIKAEPRDDEPEPVMAPADGPSSPESRRKGKEKIKTRALSGSAAERPVHQTQDEVDEWERHQRDLKIVFSELGTQARPAAAAARDRDGDAAMEGAPDPQSRANDKKADKVYLFQFPPVLPDLKPIVVKPDPEDAPHDDATPMGVDAQPNSNTASNPVTVPDADTSAPRPPKLPSGVVGKLRIHRSGKATLDWGGTKLNVGMGTEASFLQDVVVISVPEKKIGENDGDGGGGWAMGMGQVKGKFVVVPDWEDVFG